MQGLDTIFKNIPVDLGVYKKRANKLLAYARKKGKEVAEDYLYQQKEILITLSAVRFEGANAAQAQRNISYRYKQIDMIFARAENQAARAIAKEWIAISKDLLNILSYVAKGLISLI